MRIRGGQVICSMVLWFSTNVSVAKRKSMFDDKATEVNELTFVVKQNLGRWCRRGGRQ